MFESKKQPALHTLVGEGTLVQGKLQFPGGILQIDGQVQGDVVSTGERPSIIQVGEKGSVTGRLQATHVVISGRVTGPVQADGLLELKSRAAIVGSVKYQALEMQQGATIEGELHPIHAQTQSPPTPQSPSDEPTLEKSP